MQPCRHRRGPLQPCPRAVLSPHAAGASRRAQARFIKPSGRTPHVRTSPVPMSAEPHFERPARSGGRLHADARGGSVGGPRSEPVEPRRQRATSARPDRQRPPRPLHGPPPASRHMTVRPPGKAVGGFACEGSDPSLGAQAQQTRTRCGDNLGATVLQPRENSA
jgi:hypothetical protein